MIKLWASLVFVAATTLTYADARVPWQKGDEAVLSGFTKSISLQQKLAAATKTGKRERRYPLGDYGSLRIEFPSSWKDEVQQVANVPPTIFLTPTPDNASLALISPIWGVKKEALQEEAIRESVQRSAEKAKSQSVEKTLKPVGLQGASGKGFYFFSTDKAPKPGEWKYMTQGVLVVGELMVTFTILTNDKQSEVIKETLTILKEARHLK